MHNDNLPGIILFITLFLTIVTFSTCSVMQLKYCVEAGYEYSGNGGTCNKPESKPNDN